MVAMSSDVGEVVVPIQFTPTPVIRSIRLLHCLASPPRLPPSRPRKMFLEHLPKPIGFFVGELEFKLFFLGHYPSQKHMTSSRKGPRASELLGLSSADEPGCGRRTGLPNYFSQNVSRRNILITSPQGCVRTYFPKMINATTTAATTKNTTTFPRLTDFLHGTVESNLG